MSPQTHTVTARDVAAVTGYIARAPARWIATDEDDDIDEVLHCVWKNDDTKAHNSQDWVCMYLLPPLALFWAALLPCTLMSYIGRMRAFKRERYAVSNKRFFYWKANAAHDVWSCPLRDVQLGWDSSFCGTEYLTFQLLSEDAARVGTLITDDKYRTNVQHYSLFSMLDEESKLRAVIETAQENAEKRHEKRKSEGKGKVK